jgi:two-component system sensor histidine kinase PilS (NtrC family)
MRIASKDQPADQAGTAASANQTWLPLRYFNLYRLLLSGLFATLYFSGNGPKLFGEHNPELFGATSLIYLGCVLISGFAHRWQWPAFRLQLRLNVLVDIVAITLLTHASGGVESGLGMLLLITLAGGGLLMSGRAILFFAAIATLSVLIEQVYANLVRSTDSTAYTQTGILGATFFAAALLANVLAQRVRTTEALATQRGIDLANMEQLNAYIIQHLQSGILVVDNTERVRLMNESAWYLLSMPSLDKQQHLHSASPTLAAHLSAWRKDSSFEPPPFRATPTGADLLARFTRLGGDHPAGSVIFLEDSAAMAQQAQQMKLASLGRLTASIAHEIRNPLGAISHAGQLLHESPELNSGDRRLTEIIHDQALRVNTIIENILQLARRERSRPQDVPLLPWLEDFAAEFVRDLHLAPGSVSIEITPPDVEVRMDPGHLRQVLWNLCENAVHHGDMTAAGLRIELRGGLNAASRDAVLDVIDHGRGINAEDAQQIFEPFFTTNRQGTGLGLYIARELCEFNKAQLRHVPMPDGGCCFRISFMDARRQVLSA